MGKSCALRHLQLAGSEAQHDKTVVFQNPKHAKRALDAVGTQHTDPEKWPGKNILGNILQKVANKVRKSQHQWIKVKSAKAKSGQLDISHMLVRKHGKRSRDKRRSKDQSSSRENSPRKRSKSVHRKRATRRDSRSRDESSSTSSESACETEQ